MAIFGSLFGGDGMAWRREQKDILDWAKNLYYPEAGGSLIPETDDKATWDAWKNKFLSWKDAEIAKSAGDPTESSSWWYKYPRGLSGGGEGGGESASSPIEIGPSPMQERAASNIYFPMLVPEYSSPQALDYSAYMPSDSPFGGMGGLLYQPGTQQYQEAFPMDMNILRYQPPQLLLPQVTYSNPIQGFSIPVMGEESTDRNGRPQKPNNDPSNDQRGGRAGDGDTTPLGISQHKADLLGYATVDKSKGTSSGNDQSRPGGAPASGPHGG